MRVRPLAYFILFLLDITLLYIQIQLYTSAQETITYPQLGYLNFPKEIFMILLVGSTLMLPYIATLLVGAIVEAEWLNSTRLYCAITALMVEIARGLFKMELLEGNTFLLSFVDIAFIYLLVEGTITVLEGFKSG